MRGVIIIILCLVTFSKTSQINENCVVENKNCNDESEYNAYIECMAEMRRQKRSAGCEEECEIVDCSQCGQKCTPNCHECGDCSTSCRKCCSETCTTNLCCHKTCHNQCRTNHCRAVCKRDCKHRITDSELTVITGNRNSSSNARHNITTIINLHNIINNTNLIDIPIKINNTNYNNITLRREGDGFVQVDGLARLGEETTTSAETTEETCCSIIGPRQCVNVNYFPFIRCFHYRHRKCGSLCTSPIMHSQHQRLCNADGCHNKLVYIPQPRSRCHYNPVWPYVLCGQTNYLPNCQGCYAHYTSNHWRTPQGRCSRCYDDGFGIGPYYRQGPFYRPSYSHVPPCWQIGNCGYPMMVPMLPYYPNYLGYNPMITNYGGMYPGAFGGYPMQSVDPGYSIPNYVHDINIPASSFNSELSLKSGETNPDSNSSDLSYDIGPLSFKNPRYAVIAIDTSKQKEKRFKRKKGDKSQKVEKEMKTKNDVTNNDENENSTQNTTEKYATDKPE